MSVETFNRGTAIRLPLEIKDYLGAYLDVIPKVTITDPDGAVKVDAADATKDAAGQCHYTCQTLEAWPKGLYLVKATATSGGYTALVAAGLFRLA